MGPTAAACASAEGVRHPTIAGASWINASFSRAATMNKAKSTRRVLLLSEDGITHMPTPHGQALALALFEVASAHDCPQRVAGKHPAARLDLVVNVHKSSETPDPAGGALFPLEPPWIYIPAVTRDVPPTGKDKACARTGVVEDRLSCSRRVVVRSPRETTR